MLKNLFSKTDDQEADPKVVADLKRTLSPGDRVGFFHEGELLGKSLLVAIEESHLLFEPLAPVDDLLNATEIANIQRGIPWDFEVPGLSEVTEGQDNYIRCEVPETIRINSRRENFRVPIPISSNYEVGFLLGDKRFKARILDLSSTGAQIRIASNSNFSTAEQQLIHEAGIRLGDELEFAVQFHVRWVQYLSETARMGIVFEKLSAAESDAIHRIVNEVEREIIRRTKLLKQ